MNTRIAWTIAGVVVLGALVVGATQLSAQRPPREGPGAGPGPGAGGGFGGGFMMGPNQVGRYTVARVHGEDVILDTTTGDIYKVALGDFKKFSERPKGPPPGFAPGRFGGGGPPDVEKDRPRDRKEPERPKDAPRGRDDERPRDRKEPERPKDAPLPDSDR